MPKAGCPNNWFDGRRFHDDTDSNLIDRKVYDSLDLAGWVSKEGMSKLLLLLYTNTTVCYCFIFVDEAAVNCQGNRQRMKYLKKILVPSCHISSICQVY